MASSIPQQEAAFRSDKLLSDQKCTIIRRIHIVWSISTKHCSKFYVALLLSKAHLRRFYYLMKYHYDLQPVSTKQQFFHAFIRSRWHKPTIRLLCSIISNQDIVFMSAELHVWMIQNAIRHQVSSTYHPATAGQTERKDRYLTEMFAANEL